MPLIALLNGIEFDANDLEESHRGLNFRCPDPECNDILQVVIGKIKIKHFRHTTKIHHIHEPETLEHLALKRLVKDSCDSLKISCKLEPYLFLKNQKRNPDCLITFDDEIQKQLQIKGIAVECQCAPMHTKIYEERNMFYLDNEYTPVWILGEKNFSSRIFNQGDNDIRLKGLERHILQDYLKIYYYNGKELFQAQQSFDYEKNYQGISKPLEQTSLKEIFDYVIQTKDRLFKEGTRCGFFFKVDNKWVSSPNYKIIKDHPLSFSNSPVEVETKPPVRYIQRYNPPLQAQLRQGPTRWQDKMMYKFIDIEEEYDKRVETVDQIYEVIKEYIIKYDDISLSGIVFYLEYKNFKKEYKIVCEKLYASTFIGWNQNRMRFYLKQK